MFQTLITFVKSFSRGRNSFKLLDFFTHLKNNNVKYIGFQEEIKK